MYSQKLNNDTLFVKNVVKSSWAIKYEVGILLNQNPKQFENIYTFTPDDQATIFYKHYHFSWGCTIQDLRPKGLVTINRQLFNNTANFEAITIFMALGYIYDFNKNWGADIKFGYMNTTFELSNPLEIGMTNIPIELSGGNLGLRLNRYIKIKHFNYIVLSLGAEYNMINYSKISKDLNNNYMDCFLTVAYKGWFRKLIR